MTLSTSMVTVNAGAQLHKIAERLMIPLRSIRTPSRIRI